MAELNISAKAEIEKVENGFLIFILKDHKRYVAQEIAEVAVILERELGKREDL
jgi:hypothetical protein